MQGSDDGGDGRGIIPRSVEQIFEATQALRAKGWVYDIEASALEIYNEAGYELLDPSHETKGLEDLPKVTLQEDHDGRIHLRYLSAQLARNEEEALNLLFGCDTIRMISETPMNMASSRSHCIFTVSLESREAGSDAIRRSKLHLVDLDHLYLWQPLWMRGRCKNLVQVGNLPEGHISTCDLLRGLHAYARGEARFWSHDWMSRLRLQLLDEHLRVILRRRRG